MNIRALLIKIIFCLPSFIALLNGMEKPETPNFLDKTFGNNGIVTTDFGMNSGTYNRYAASIHVKIQPDHKIIVVGDAYRSYDYELRHPESSFALVRYNTDGKLDASFGDDGKVVLSLSKLDSYGIDLALQKDGKIVVVGRSFDRGYYHPDAIMIRLNEDGTLDNSFGHNGIILENNQENEVSQFWGVAIQNDGKIIAIGDKGKHKQQRNTLDYNSFLIARYNVDGAPDLSFGNNGKTVTSLKVGNFTKQNIEEHEADNAFGLSVQSDGKIIVVGSAEDTPTLDISSGIYNADCGITCYEESGQLDELFGKDKNGMLITSVSKLDNCFFDVVIQSDEKIVAIGLARNISTNKDEFLVARYLKNGILDDSFGENKNGLVLTSLGTDHARATNVILQKDDKILVTGVVTWDKHTKFTVVRYTIDGLLDDTFGEDGILVTPIGNFDDKSFAMAMQEDGKLIVVGNAFDGKQYNFALVRYNSHD